MSADILTFDYQDTRKELELSGWRTPETYCNSFDCAGDFPAVYLFILVDRLEYKFALPAYVGMSTRLSQRWSGHEVMNELQVSEHWVQRWFLRVPKHDLRKVERSYIHKFDPPWNITGRRRGVALS